MTFPVENWGSEANHWLERLFNLAMLDIQIKRGDPKNHDFLEIYAESIDTEDRAIAQRYIDEEGFLD